MKKPLLISVSLLFFCLITNAQQYILTSPDGKLAAQIEVAKQSIQLKLTKDTEELFKVSGIALITGAEKYPAYKVRKMKRNAVKETVVPTIREKSAAYPNEYNELTISFQSGTDISFRLFNEGLAYRFSTHAKDSLLVFKENLNIELQPGDSARFQSEKSFSSAYEEPYEFRQIDKLDTVKIYNLPFLIEKTSGKFIMITESDLYRYPGMWLKSNGTAALSDTHPPFPKTYTYSNSAYNTERVKETEDYIARVAGTRTYPWRIFGVADREEGLINNNMVYLLASPAELKDVSWIKPGVVMFD